MGKIWVGHPRWAAVIAAGLLVGLLLPAGRFDAPAADALSNADPAFTVETVISGLDRPTAVRFAPDGRVLVAEKVGTVLIYDGLDDTSPDVSVDVSGDTHEFWDRGLLGLEVDPDWPTTPWVYVFYTLDPGNSYDDNCGLPNPRRPQDGIGCPANGRLSRFNVDVNNVAGPEQVILEGFWCEQFPSHSVGDLRFGRRGRALRQRRNRRQLQHLGQSDRHRAVRKSV